MEGTNERLIYSGVRSRAEGVYAGERQVRLKGFGFLTKSDDETRALQKSEPRVGAATVPRLASIYQLRSAYSIGFAVALFGGLLLSSVFVTVGQNLLVN